LLFFFFFSPVAVAVSASAGARRCGSRGDGTAARGVVEPRDIFSFRARFFSSSSASLLSPAKDLLVVEREKEEEARMNACLMRAADQ
jgi:hypothetical protein